MTAGPTPHPPNPSQPSTQQSAPPASGSSAQPPVRLRKVVAVSGWALLLALAGLAVGFWVMIGLMMDPPAWFEPTIVAIGVLGMGLTIGAFPTVHHRYTPWLCLGAATAVLITSVVLAATTL